LESCAADSTQFGGMTPKHDFGVQGYHARRCRDNFSLWKVAAD
jgi:hypothetical protein